MNKLKTLFPPKASYAAADTVNHAGAPAFTRSLEERAIQILMTGNFESTYYCSAESLTKEALAILSEISSKNPEFLAKAIIYARNEGYLRIAPIVGLLVLSVDRPDLFRKIFGRVILQPGDLQDFVTLARSKSIRSTGKSVRKAIGEWMNSISDYHVVKYGAPQKKPGAGSPTNLRDILRLSHPVPSSDAQAALFQYIVKRIKGDKISAELLAKLPEKVRGYEEFKALTSSSDDRLKIDAVHGQVKSKLRGVDETRALELVEKHDLPYEVVMARLSTPAAWRVLASKAPFMNMLRNLNNYEKNGVFRDAELKAKIIGRLKNDEQIAKSKQFPFRFLAAYNAFKGDPDVRDALVVAVEKSVMNIPDLGVTLVAPDESGSMDSPVSERSEISMKQVGNLFAAALYKKSAGGFMVPFTTKAFPVGFEGPNVNRKDSIVTVAEMLGSINGGTDLSAPLEWALDRKFDTGVFITDSESWADLLDGGAYRYGNKGILDRIRQYRLKNPKANFFFIQIVANTAVQAPQSEPGVHFIYGWSDQVLKYIGQAIAGGQSQVAAVKAVDLDAVKPVGFVKKDNPVSIRKVAKSGKVVAVKPAKAKSKSRRK